MSELRWILIGFGIALLAAIYLWGRRSNRTAITDDALIRPRSDSAPQSVEPQPIVEQARDQLDAADIASGNTFEAASDTWRGRVEPTLVDAPTVELPVRPEPTRSEPARSESAVAAPTLSSSEAPQARRVERRKILSLRLSFTPQRVEGAKLQETLLGESLQHGKYSIFHRLHTDGTVIFSIASMVEPGTFDLEKMSEGLYPGITLFAQLPGPVPGMHALNELVACARRLQQSLGGTLQDERGVPLTVHRIERMRQEVREFERPPAGGGRGGASSHSAHL